MKPRRVSVAAAALLAVAGIQSAPAQAPVEEPGSVAQRLERLERLLDSKGLLDMVNQLQGMEAEMSRLRGEIEVQNHELEQLRRRQRDLYSDIDQRMQRLEGGGAAPAGSAGVSVEFGPDADGDEPPLESLSPVAGSDEEPPPASTGESLTVETVQQEPPAPAPQRSAPRPAAPAAAPAAPVQAEADPVQARNDYQQAFNLLKQSLYEQAVRAFRQYLATHPGSEYADNAQYWLAEAYYVMRQFEPALAEYQVLVENYPESQKFSHALLKIAFCQQELGQTEAARQGLESLIQSYPGTTAARLAEERLRTLDSAGAQPAPG